MFRMYRMYRRQSTLLGFLLLVITRVSVADPVDLQAWLEHQGGPALVRLANSEARFQGETLNLVAINGGQVSAFEDGLSLHIRDELRQQLLAGTRLRLQLTGDTCRLNRSGLALGISIDRLDRSRHRVELAFLDLAEGFWINGSNQVWTGRLDTEAAALFARGKHDSTRTIPAEDPDQVARLVYQQLDCHTRFAEPVHVMADDGGLAETIAGRLNTLLENTYAVTSDPAAAATRLTVTETGAATGGLRISLGFANAAGELAGVNVTPRYEPTPLLSVINRSDAPGDCRGHGRRCVDIEYQVLDDAFVFEFFSLNGSLVTLNCEAEPRRRFGDMRQSLKVPRQRRADPNRPALGYYVLAVRDPAGAGQLHELLVDTGSCQSRPDESMLAQLSVLVSQHKVDWQAIHFRDRRGRIELL